MKRKVDKSMYVIEEVVRKKNSPEREIKNLTIYVYKSSLFLS